MEANDFYKKKLDQHKKTGFMFGVIKFDFSLHSEIATAFLAILFLIFSIATGFIFTSFFLFFVFSKEYRRVYKIRDNVLEDCLVSEELFKIEMGENGCDPNYSHDPLYVTEDDRRFFFKDSIGSYRSNSFLKNLSLLVKRSKVI